MGLIYGRVGLLIFMYLDEDEGEREGCLDELSQVLWI